MRRVTTGLAGVVLGVLVSRAADAQTLTAQPISAAERIEIETRVAGFRSDRVSHAVLLRNGAIILADHAGDRLVILGPTDRRARVFGRNGSGPGEFRSIRSLAVCGGDTVAVLDAMLMRVSFFDGTGSPIGQTAVQGMPNALSCSDTGMLAVQSLTAPPAPGRMAVGDIVRLARDGRRADTVGSALLSNVPFGEQGPLGHVLSAVAIGRSIAFGSGDSAGIQIIADGRRATQFFAGIPGRSVTDAHYESAVETIATSIPGTPADYERMRAMIRRLPRPKFLPAFATFVVDEPAQEFFIQRSFAPDSPTVIERRARDGKLLALLALPGSHRVLYARNRVLLTTQVGEETLPNLQLFRLAR